MTELSRLESFRLESEEAEIDNSMDVDQHPTKKRIREPSFTSFFSVKNLIIPANNVAPPENFQSVENLLASACTKRLKEYFHFLKKMANLENTIHKLDANLENKSFPTDISFNDISHQYPHIFKEREQYNLAEQRILYEA
jgi:hypothetical protein